MARRNNPFAGEAKAGWPRIENVTLAAIQLEAQSATSFILGSR
jgi:hypothetical protein